MTRVVAASRLHFGLLHVPAEGISHWSDGTPVRRFGGVGLMVRHPGVAVRVTPAVEWSAEGPSAERALRFARRAAETLCAGRPPGFRVQVEWCPPEHVGLGVGTQLGLAVARAVTTALGHPDIPATDLATMSGRGLRSGIGVAGFDTGGLIVDGGRSGAGTPAAAVAGCLLPPGWRVVLARPRPAGLWHGPQELHAFARPRDPDAALRLTDRMCRLTLLGLLPAIHQDDFRTFGEALHEYNRLAGEAFAADQGGPYASAEVAAVIAAVRSYGVPGAGQSSWGPTVFAVCDDPAQALDLGEHLLGLFPDLADVTVTYAADTGATVQSS